MHSSFTAQVISEDSSSELLLGRDNVAENLKFTRCLELLRVCPHLQIRPIFGFNLLSLPLSLSLL